MRIAVVGSGIAGNAAAYVLSRDHEVVVYEKEARPGGHSATVDIVHDGREIAVDTGFIVYNERNYPNLTALFAHLGMETEPSDMTFSVSLDGGRQEWSSTSLWTVFARRRNLISPRFLAMLREVNRFNGAALADLRAGRLAGLSLGDYARQRDFSDDFLTLYLLPMAGAIWSTPPREMLAFPAEAFIAFYDNHGLIHPGRAPQWRTVSGGSRAYVERLTAPLQAGLRLASPVTSIAREAGRVRVRDAGGGEDLFDHVVIAAHSDQALAMLADPSERESAVLGAIAYRDNTVYLHRDASLMPRRRRAWAAWNFLGGAEETARESTAVTYWMNLLQNIDPTHEIFVSLNPPRPPRDEAVFGAYAYAHPQFDREALDAQRSLAGLQGERNTWYCGAYHGYGFHEDGLVSGLNVAEALGSTRPWGQDAPAADAAE